MSDENRAEVGLDVKIDEATAAIAELKNSFASFSSEVKDHLEKVTTASDMLLEKVKSMVEVFLSFEGAKKGVEVLKDMGVEAEKMAARLGVGQSETSRFAVAIDDVHGSVEQVLGVMQRQNRQMRTNEDAMNSLGLVTRDANGNFLSQQDILLNSVETLKRYKEGTDRNLAASVLFGGRVGDLTAIMKLNNEVLEEAKQKADALGLTMTKQDVEAVSDYRKSLNDLDDVMKALWKQLGEAVMPILTDLANWFSGAGKEAVSGFSVSVKVVATAFNGLVLAVQIVTEVIVTTVRVVAERLLSLAEVAERALHLDFAGAVVAWQRGTDRMREVAKGGFDRILDDAQKTKKRLDDLWNPDKTDAAGPKAGKSFRDPTTNADRAGDIDARIAIAKKGLEIETEYLKGEAAAKRITEVQKVDLVRQAAESEYQFERDLMQKKAALYANTPKEYQKALAEIDKLDAQHGLDIQKSAVERQAAEKKMRDEQTALTADEIKQRVAMADEGAKQESLYLDQQVALGNITAAKKLEIERAVLQSTYEYKRAELEREATLYENDPTQVKAYQKMLQEIEKLDAQHQQVLQKNANDTTNELKKQWGSIFSSISSAVEKSVTGMIMGTTTLQKALGNIWQAILGEFISMCAKMVTQWLASQAAMSAMSGAGVFGSLFGASGLIGGLGSLFGGGEAASLAAGIIALDTGTPYVKRSGLAYIHEGEAVVTKAQNPNAGGGGASSGATTGGGDTYHLNVSAIDGQSVKRLFLEHGPAIAQALRSQTRSFTPSGPYNPLQPV